MLSLVNPLRLVNELKIVLVTKIAVNMEIIIPQNKTVAKPRMGPVPNCQSTKAAITVVKLASIMVVRARL